MSLQLVPQITGYELIEPIRGGGQGVVYRARQTSTGRLVAIKALKPDALGEPNAIQRFLHEGKAVACLQHPNIVTLHDMGHESGVHYLVMELIDGPDLYTWIKTSGPMPVRLACDCIRQAALGLQHAFEHGLIHRDLKPSNLVRRQSDGLVKVLDLGLARFSTQREHTELLTATGAILGTPDFMAPEQFDNPSAVTTRADIYSLGCTLYYLLTGRVPFPGESLARKMDGHRWHWPKPLEKCRPDVPLAVASFCARLLAKQPEDRPAGPAEVAQELATTMAGLEATPEPKPAATVRDSSGVCDTPGEHTPPTAHFPPDYVGQIRCLRGHGDYVTTVAFSPSGDRLASGCLDGEVLLWDAESETLEHRWPAGPAIWALHTDAAKGTLLAARSDGTIHPWDLDSLNSAGAVQTASLSDTDAAAFCPRGRHVAFWTGVESVLVLWDLLECREAGRVHIADKENGLGCLAFSGDGAQLFGAARQGDILSWSIPDLRGPGKLSGHAGPAYCLHASPNARWLASGGYDKSVRVWDLSSGEEIAYFPGHLGSVRGLAFSSDCLTLLSAGNDHVIRCWDLPSGQETHRLEGHTKPVISLAVSSDGRRAVSGSNDRTVRVWQMQERG